jgi:hypothetical protein
VSACVQVWHYDGTEPADEINDGDESSTEDDDFPSPDDDSTTAQRLELPEGPVCAPEQDGLPYPLNKPHRMGKFYDGVITRFDSWSQAHFIEFNDGTEGWYQLWRPYEHFYL